MSTVTFDTTPHDLKASASNIDQRLQEFIQSFNRIYSATNDLKVQYKGQASDTFNQRIEGYRADFTAAETVLRNYIEFLNFCFEEHSICILRDSPGRASQLPRC